MTGPDQLRIADHGVVGDLHTVALVGSDGRIDFACWPRVDSPAVFLQLLDAERGGVFSVAPQGASESRQMYLPDSNVLMTRFFAGGSIGELLDAMVPQVGGAPCAGGHPLVRRIRVVRGCQTFEVACRPSFDWARSPHRVEVVDGVGAVFRSAAGCLTLRTRVPLEVDGTTARASVTLREGEHLDLLLHWGDDDVRPVGDSEAEELIDWTVGYWQRWLSRCTYAGRWRETVQRSALLLKLLVHEPTGALVAAPTAGLPEDPGGVRNWDYRYTWLRDAAFTTYALMRLGFEAEGTAFLAWLEERMGEATPEQGLLPVYTVDGTAPPAETELEHLGGFFGARPVRIGNDAAGQLQLDTYGEVMDSIYLANKQRPISWDFWTRIVRCLDWLGDHAGVPDAGLWESRGEPQVHTYSQVMTWVAFERGLRLARQRGLPAPVQRWSTLAGEAYRRVQDEAWDEAMGAYPAWPGAGHLDASALVMPLVKFAGPTDPRFTSTLDRISERLVTDSLVRRYEPDGGDGLEGGEGTFSLCSFWYVEALTRAGRLREARATFEKTLTYANHLGLFAEQLGAAGEHLGNFPQALTHLSLISAAVNLDRVLR